MVTTKPPHLTRAPNLRATNKVWQRDFEKGREPKLKRGKWTESKRDQKRTEAKIGRHRSGSSGGGNPNKEGGTKGKKGNGLNQGKKKEGSGRNRKLTIIMGFKNHHFTKGKTYIKTHSPLKTPGVVPPPYSARKYPMRHRAQMESRDI